MSLAFHAGRSFMSNLDSARCISLSTSDLTSVITRLICPMVLPMARPSSGSLLGPNTRRATTKITISSCIPRSNIRGYSSYIFLVRDPWLGRMNDSEAINL